MKRRASWIAGAVVLVAVVALGILALLRVQDVQGAAQSARADAKAGLKSLEAGDATSAQASFERAAGEFSRGRDLLGPAWLRSVPFVGRQLDAADDLFTIGLEGSGAGSEAAQLLGKASGASDRDRLGQLLALAHPHLDAALVHLTVVADRVDGLTTDGLVPPLAGAVTELNGLLDPLRTTLERSESLLALERYVFSGQHRFLVLAQNGAQLRPTGGFPGTYGLVEVGPDGLKLSEFADIFTLPADTLMLPSPPGMDKKPQLYLRNANWWIDFPTSGEVITRLWESMEPRQPKLDGIIALDLSTISDLLKVFGPIRVPESKVALTWQNVVEQLSYVVEVEKSGLDEQNKKNAVVSLAKAVMKRLLDLSDDEFRPVMTALATSANQRHIQLYLTDADAQRALVATGWSGAIAPPEGTTDVLAVSHAIVKRPAKGNMGVAKSLDYQVQLGEDGTAATVLTLGYHKDPDVPLGYLADRFRPYLRVHRATGTTLDGESPFTAVDDATGLPTFARTFGVPKAASATVELRTRVPDAVRDGVAPPTTGAAPSADVGTAARHYRLLLVRQADLVDTDTTITVQAPSGWRIVSSAAEFRNDGARVATSGDAQHVSLATPLLQDLVLDLTLERA
ncbi:MAG: DUF4012 domain-containing protein [Actinobacteria bacterium]|nr:DUF4012 domain-containing protein [Actinomycetota bacterium]